MLKTVIWTIIAAIFYGVLSRFIPDEIWHTTAWLEQAGTWGFFTFVSSIIFTVVFRGRLKYSMTLTILWLVVACLSYETEWLVRQASNDGLVGAWYEFIHHKLIMEIVFSLIGGIASSCISYFIVNKTLPIIQNRFKPSAKL
jgi:hypothetical protein